MPTTGKNARNTTTSPRAAGSAARSSTRTATSIRSPLAWRLALQAAIHGRLCLDEYETHPRQELPLPAEPRDRHPQDLRAGASRAQAEAGAGAGTDREQGHPARHQAAVVLSRASA